MVGTYAGLAPIWHLHVGGQVIPTTSGHPFWVRGQGWTTVAEMRPGQELRTGQGGWMKVGNVVDTGRSAPVYNLEVEGDHTYFVGDPVTWGFSLWAHNGCGVHGNSLKSTRPTKLYQKVDATTGEHLKFGMSSDLAKRYSQASLNRNNEAVIDLMTGTRAQIAAIERSATSQMPGIQNLEAWAGSMIRSVP